MVQILFKNCFLGYCPTVVYTRRSWYESLLGVVPFWTRSSVRLASRRQNSQTFSKNRSPIQRKRLAVSHLGRPNFRDKRGIYSGQWSRNIKGKLYMGYEEREWLEMSEKAIYLPRGNATFYKKDLQCRCYINQSTLNFLGVPNLLTTKGSTRWETVWNNQFVNIRRKLCLSSDPVDKSKG